MKPSTKLLLSIIPASLFLVATIRAFPTGPVAAVTGGFGEPTCDQSGCHNSFQLNAGKVMGLGDLVISGLPKQYQPGTTYPIKVTVTHTQGRGDWGFQLAARFQATGAQAGDLKPINRDTQIVMGNQDPMGNGIQYIEHTMAGINSNVFEFNWVAPANPMGDVIMHAAGNAGNGDLTPSGDYIYTTSATSSPANNPPPPPPPPPTSSSAPQISSGGVLGAGLSNPPVKQIAANGIISIFGQNFAPAGTVKLISGSDLVDGKLPTNFAGLCVQVGGDKARFFHVFEKQLNVQVPSLTDRGNISIRVIQNCGQPNEVQSNAETVTIQAQAPEFFFFKQNPDGKNPIAAINAVTFGLIGAPNMISGVTFTPAKPGDILALYSTGLGATNPPVQAGALPSGIASTVDPVTVTVGGLNADVLYAGVAPGLAGLYQINITIPNAAPDGDLPVIARIGGLSTPAGGFVTVKK